MRSMPALAPRENNPTRVVDLGRFSLSDVFNGIEHRAMSVGVCVLEVT